MRITHLNLEVTDGDVRSAGFVPTGDKDKDFQEYHTVLKTLCMEFIKGQFPKHTFIAAQQHPEGGWYIVVEIGGED